MITTYRYNGPDSFSQTRTVRISDMIALWLARMCVGEGGQYCSIDSCRAMTWAMLNRFFLHTARKKWPSFLTMVKLFSQPINQRWSRGGDLARKYAGTKYTTEEKLDRREHIQSLEWSDISWHIEDAVLKFEEGLLLPSDEIFSLEKKRISNWASHENTPKKFPWGLSLGDNNWFFEDRRLIEGTVVIDHW